MNATGRWALVVKTPVGEQTITLDLKEEGNALTGTQEDPQNAAAPIVEGSAQGNELRWKFPVSKPFKTTLVFNVQRDGDLLKGTCKAGVFPAAPANGKRA